MIIPGEMDTLLRVGPAPIVRPRLDVISGLFVGESIGTGHADLAPFGPGDPGCHRRPEPILGARQPARGPSRALPSNGVGM